MDSEEYDFSYEILLVGNAQVGKSSILSKYIDGTFDEVYTPTIGMEFKFKLFEQNGKTTKQKIWDFSGAKKFQSIISKYYGGANGVIIIYDVTNRESFENVDYYMKEIQEYANENICIFLWGNMIDKTSERVVTSDEGCSLAAKHNIELIETSALNGTNINELFTLISAKIKSKLEIDSSY